MIFRFRRGSEPQRRRASLILSASLVSAVLTGVSCEQELPFSRKPGLSNVDFDLLEGDIAVPRNIFRKGVRPTTIFLTKRWTSGLIHYSFHKSAREKHRHVIQEAIKHWQDNTCLSFNLLNNSSLSWIPHRIRFRTDKPGCWSLIGSSPLASNLQDFFSDLELSLTSYQDINLEDPGCMHVPTVIHEIGHAVGFFHEQSRSDRDNHLTLLFENMDPDMRDQFEKQRDMNFDVPYDYSSVMQYPPWAFSKDTAELNTIITKDPLMQLSLGGDALTFRDKKLANAMYNCSAGCTNQGSLKCENEGFLFARYQERRECSCTCPPNTSGERCETVTRKSYYEGIKCGGKITTEGTIQTQNIGKPCIFWIQAPEGKRVSLKFGKFDYPKRKEKERDSKPKCLAAKVEIRLEDTVHGQMYCGDALAGKQITSTAENLILISSQLATNSTSGFEASVSFQ